MVGDRLLAAGKRGIGYLLDAARMGGIGGQLTRAPICPAFGAGAVSGSTVYLPCADGTRAVELNPTGGLTVRWRAAVPADGSPVVGGGAVWAADTARGVLYALDPETGTPRAQIEVGLLPRIASPTLSGQHATTTAINVR